MDTPSPAGRAALPRLTASIAALAAVLIAAALTVVAVPGAHADSGSDDWATTWSVAEGSVSNLGDCNPCSTRQTVHTSIGGGSVRLVLSNLNGTVPLTVAETNVSLPAAYDSSASIPGTRTAITFGGQASVTIPAGGSVTSDPVAYAVAADSDLQISNYFPGNAQLTDHVNGTRSTSYVWRGSDQTAVDAPGPDSTTPQSFFVVSEVDVLPAAGAAAPAGSVALLGDSITDGTGSTADADDRWGNKLATRLDALPVQEQLGVANVGISGNRILLDGTGPSAISRFQRDVLDRAGVRSVIILEGINDIRQLAEPVDVAGDAADIENALTSMAQQAHAAGIRVIGGTITPWKGYTDYTDDREAVRQAVNTWIRTTAVSTGVYDSYVDFDAALNDPSNPSAMRPGFDSGDHLHPGPAGYQAMADAIDLADLGAYPRPGTVSLLAPTSVPRGVTTHLTATVTAAAGVQDASVHFVLPSGWTTAEDPNVDLGPLAAGQSAAATIAVTAGGIAGKTIDTDLLASASLDGMVTSAGQTVRVLTPDGVTDTTPPDTQVTETPSAPSASGWFTRPVSVTASATDDSGGYTYVEYRVDGGAWAPILGPVTIGDGSHTVEVRSSDADGNVSDPVTRQIDVDTVAPQVSATVDDTARTVTASATDAGSGVARLEYQLDGGGWTPYTAPVTVGASAATVDLRATDVAGNVSTPTEEDVPATPPSSPPPSSPPPSSPPPSSPPPSSPPPSSPPPSSPPPSSPPPSSTPPTVAASTVEVGRVARVHYGTAARLSVTVASVTGVPVTGRVAVAQGGRTLAGAALARGRVTVPLPRTLAVGTHHLTVAYAGSGTVGASRGAVTVTVVKATSAVRVKAPATTTAKRAEITVRITSAGARTGRAVVVVTHATTSVRKRVKVSAAGTARLRLPRLARPGRYTVKVTFQGSATAAKASRTAHLTVRKV